MNDQDIRRLWYRACIGSNEENQNCENEVVQRFARAIAEECANHIDAGSGEMCSMAEHICRNQCRDAIRRYFGVE
jgi:hypothetical protein